MTESQEFNISFSDLYSLVKAESLEILVHISNMPISSRIKNFKIWESRE